MFSLSILFFAFFICCGKTENVLNTESVIKTWAEHAHKWFTSQNCSDFNTTSESSCTLMKSVEKYNYRIYATEPPHGRKIGTVFPDGDPKQKIFYDGVIVLDAFPNSRFGHPILVFHVHNLNNQSECDALKGFLVENQYCLQPFNRSQCNRNGIKRGIKNKPPFLGGPNCGEVIFLPMVYLQSEKTTQLIDKLRCIPSIDGFNRFCPDLRNEAVATRIACHPFLNNEKNCGYYDRRAEGRCSTSQTCDHAVLLSGGWNRQLSDISTWNNVNNVKRLLMSHGFLENNIAMFYANGPKHSGRKKHVDNSQEDEYEDDDGETERYYSSSMKEAMRNQIKTLCDTEYCSDTLFIYMNSPARPDGSSLLWDLFDDGVYSENEIYTPKELFRDIHRCKANRVIILADQNYGSALVLAAEARFISLQNVIIFTAAGEFNYNASKDRLTAQLIREKYFDVCLSDFRNVINKSHKSAEFIGYKINLLNATLVGGPCAAKATSLNDPEVKKYRGCSLAPLV